MAVDRCPKHGMQIWARFCEHVATAINDRRVVTVYLQKHHGDWVGLCDTCVRGLDDPRTLEDATEFVCQVCILEWAAATGSDYVQRCQDPKPEFPP